MSECFCKTRNYPVPGFPLILSFDLQPKLITLLPTSPFKLNVMNAKKFVLPC